jgi:fused signal recognition particle receptor
MVRFFRRKKEEQQEGQPPEVQEDGALEEPAQPEAALEDARAEEEQAQEEAGEGAGIDTGVERTRRTWFSRIGGMFRRGIDESVWEELEETLVSADTGVQTTMKIIDDVKERVKSERISDGDSALGALKDEMVSVLDVDTGRGKIWHSDGQQQTLPQPAVILVVGVNGTGKTTSIGKLAHVYKAQGKKVLLAAGDTFRAAAIEQLKHWGQRAGVEVVAHQQGADPGAVVFDALAAAEKRGSEVVIIDTAGRLHTKANLMEELRKVNRIIQRKWPDAPHEVLLVLDATSGQNAMQQAKYFTEAVGVTAVLLAKLDGTAKGGVVFSVCDQLRVPVRFVGTGERPQDLAHFQPREFVEALFGG